MLPANTNISSEVKDLVSRITLENGFSTSSAVKYSRGADPGDGFSSRTYAVDIVDGEKKLQLFLKCPLEVKDLDFLQLYKCEIYFYTIVYPAYRKFIEDKSIKNALSTSISRCYGANMDSGILALENIKVKGFRLFNKTRYMNDEHMELILRTFARFHAVSFAMKDQFRQTHDKFCDAYSYMYRRMKHRGFEKICSGTLAEFISKLDAIEDPDILDKYAHLGPKVEDVILNMPDHLSQYSTLTKGDCWVNNMMFTYEDESEEHPNDLILVDWQCLTRASPVHDINALFYCGATKEAVDNYKHYLQIYHSELSARIRELGSDPDVLYPYSIFEKEWIDCGLYGFALVVGAIKMMLRNQESIPDLQACVNDGNVADFFNNVVSNDAEWMLRVRYIARHLIEIGSV